MPTKGKRSTGRKKSGPKIAANSVNAAAANFQQGRPTQTVCSRGENAENDNEFVAETQVHSQMECDIPPLSPYASDMQQLEDEDSEFINPASTKARAPRGPTRNIKIGRRGKGDPKIALEFDENGKVCSDNSTEFANYCGYIVRDKAPQQVRGWEEIDNDIKMKIFKKIGKTYAIPVDAKIQKLIWEDMGTKYRRFRTFLKTEYYDKYKTDEERQKHLHPLLTKEDWAYLIILFSSDDFQAASKRNKSNVSHIKRNHNAGSRSFAKIRSMMKKQEGVEPGSYRVYERVHIKANGDPVDDHAKEIMDKVDMMTAQQGITREESFNKVCPPKQLNKKIKQVFPIPMDGVDIEQPTSLLLMLQQAEERARIAEEKSAQALAESKRAVQMASLHDTMRKDSEKLLTQLRQEKLDLAQEAAGARLQLSQTVRETSDFYKSLTRRTGQSPSLPKVGVLTGLASENNIEHQPTTDGSGSETE